MFILRNNFAINWHRIYFIIKMRVRLWLIKTYMCKVFSKHEIQLVVLSCVDVNFSIRCFAYAVIAVRILYLLIISSNIDILIGFINFFFIQSDSNICKLRLVLNPEIGVNTPLYSQLYIML